MISLGRNPESRTVRLISQDICLHHGVSEPKILAEWTPDEARAVAAAISEYADRVQYDVWDDMP